MDVYIESYKTTTTLIHEHSSLKKRFVALFLNLPPVEDRSQEEQQRQSGGSFSGAVNMPCKDTSVDRAA